MKINMNAIHKHYEEKAHEGCNKSRNLYEGIVKYSDLDVWR
jgi:hypothetical protein